MKNNMLETHEINFLCDLREFFCALCGLIFLLSLAIKNQGSEGFRRDPSV